MLPVSLIAPSVNISPGFSLTLTRILLFSPCLVMFLCCLFRYWFFQYQLYVYLILSAVFFPFFYRKHFLMSGLVSKWQKSDQQSKAGQRTLFQKAETDQQSENHHMGADCTQSCLLFANGRWESLNHMLSGSNHSQVWAPWNPVRQSRQGAAGTGRAQNNWEMEKGNLSAKK